MQAMVDIDRRQPSLVSTRTRGEGRSVLHYSMEQDTLEIEEISLEELLMEDMDNVFSDTPPWLPETVTPDRVWMLKEDNILEEEDEIADGDEMYDNNPPDAGMAELYCFEDYIEETQPHTTGPVTPSQTHCFAGSPDKEFIPRLPTNLPLLSSVQSTVTNSKVRQEDRKTAMKEKKSIMGRQNSDLEILLMDDYVPCFVSGGISGSVNSREDARLLADLGAVWTLEDEQIILEPTSLSTSASLDETLTTGTPLLYHTTPPKMQMASTNQLHDGRSQSEKHGGSKNSLSRLARRLSQKEKRCIESRRKTIRQRSVSLDCTENRKPLMSTATEEKAPTSTPSPPAPAQRHNDNSLSIPQSPNFPCQLSRSGSASAALAARLSRKASANKSSRRSAAEAAEKAALKDKRKINPLQELFDAVEHQQMERAKDIIENNTVDINSLNADDLTTLDIAVMSNHVPMVKMLLTHGAMENPVYLKHIDQRAMKLVSLMNEAEKHLSQLQDLVSNGGPLNTVVTTQKDNEQQQLGYWEFKQKLLKRMKEGFDQARQPEPPTKVTLSVANSSSLLVRFDEPLHHNGAVVTRYKVQWSCHENFSQLAGEQILEDLQWPYYEIPHLVQGKRYYVRVFAWNMKGFSEPVMSNPPYAVPSSWREVDDVKSRLDGKLEMLDGLFASIKNSRPADASEIKMKELHSSSYSPLHPRKSTMRKSLKHLFSASPKFQKTLKRGVYLSCLLYNDDRILVTNEDNLPIVEVDESFSSTNLQADFHWLMKVACTWDDVKSLRQDMAKNLSSSVMLFRSKLLQAVMQLQSALGIKDLGQFYHEATRDLNGSIILTTVNCVRDPRAVNMTHVKWGMLNKLHKKVAWTDNSTAPERLLLTVPEMIHYENASGTPLPRGLYLCYLKLKSSVDLIRIMVPQNKPNVLPYVQVRNNPCITREEWQWVRGVSRGELPISPPSEVQASFLDDLTEASQRLLKKLGVAADDATNHRLYDLEVIELNEDVSCVLMLPPVENVCTIPGHHEEITQQPTSSLLPVQIFEMIHMRTYKPEFISRYSRLSSILEMDMNLAQQALREAFSSDELTVAKQRVEQVINFQQTLDESWKAMRWTMDIIGYARDKNARVGLSLSTLTATLVAVSASPNNSPSSDHRSFNKIPSSSDVTSLSCSDNGYHSDRSLTENNNVETVCASGDVEEVWTRACIHMGMLMVYPAYEMGLSNITCVTLHVTSQTTARDVLQRVVHHVNQAVRNKGLNGPFYSENQLTDFCLVAVVGARERVLRDDFQPLTLQAPWTMGRLYVRLKGNLLAALERSQVTSV